MFKGSVYFWLIFTMKRKQEIAVESMLMNQEVLVVLLTAYGKSYYKRMWLHAGNETTQRHLPVYQNYQRADCQTRKDITFACSNKPELPKFILPVKIRWLIFSAVPVVEVKNLQRSEEVHLSRSYATRLVLQCERMFGWKRHECFMRYRLLSMLF